VKLWQIRMGRGSYSIRAVLPHIRILRKASCFDPQGEIHLMILPTFYTSTESCFAFLEQTHCK
jgi:hypothetical protein